MTGKVRIGTSGYHFKDWVGTVYPESLPAREFLPTYARWFDAVEVNTSFYHVPEPELFAGMLKKVPTDFVFVVKAPQEMTHRRAQSAAVADKFLAALTPLGDAGQLGGVLAQFPFSFKPAAESNHHLEGLAEVFVRRGIPASIEFRHDAWYREETYAMLRGLGLGFVNVDLPRLPHLPPPSNIVTSDVAYVRLHGRNRKTWWMKDAGGLRYDYSYDEAQRAEWGDRIEDARSDPSVRQVFVFANNCHLGASVIDALHMKTLLGAPVTLEVPSSGALFEDPSPDPLVTMTERVAAARAREPHAPGNGALR